MGFSTRRPLCYFYDIMGTVKAPPNIVVHYIEDCEGSFLTLRHMKIQLEYPDGTMSEEFVHDVVHRGKMDASVICAYDLSEKEPRIWLRSCVRPAASSRVPFPNSNGCGWELPAGLVDPGETPHDAAVRELYEEVGFKVDKGYKLGPASWGSVGLAPELIHFYSMDVTGLERGTPTEDGSPLERNGECILVSLADAARVGDMKTGLGVYRLAEFLKFLKTKEEMRPPGM